jgi:hypothetical protein
MTEPVEPLESFKDCWTTFRRQALSLLASPCTPEEAVELLKSRDALLLRLRRLKKSDEGRTLPAALALGLEQLQTYTSFESLSDAKISQLEHLVKEAELKIQSWAAGIERKTVYQISVADKERRDQTRRVITAAVGFTGLVALMAAATIQIYLNRSIS